MAKSDSIALRLEAKIERITESGCWIFMGSLHYKGYGQIRDGKMRKAHRVSYELHKGPIPDGMCVCHRCDVPQCVNPDHLFLGTTQDNTADRHSKGRTASGERAGRWKGGHSINNPREYHREYLRKWRAARVAAK